MNDLKIAKQPRIYKELKLKCKETGFKMPSDLHVGVFLKTLVASKPKSNFLELGTGFSLSLSWMIDGMDAKSKLTTIDNDPDLTEIAEHYYGQDKRVRILCEDGSNWLKNYKGAKFDLIFADAWPGKYSEIEEALALLNRGGFYVIDDMLPQPNWPLGHQKKVDHLMEYLENREDLLMTKLNWSTGIVLAVKKD